MEETNKKDAQNSERGYGPGTSLLIIGGGTALLIIALLLLKSILL